MDIVHRIHECERLYGLGGKKKMELKKKNWLIQTRADIRLIIYLLMFRGKKQIALKWKE